MPASPASKSTFKAAKVSSRSPGSGESSRSRSKKMASGVQSKGKGILRRERFMENFRGNLWSGDRQVVGCTPNPNRGTPVWQIPMSIVGIYGM